MKLKSKIVMLGALMVFALLIVNCKENAKADKAPADNEKMEVVKDDELAAATYQCPMQCEGDKTYDEPGECPICKMDLKEVKKAVGQDANGGHDNH